MSWRDSMRAAKFRGVAFYIDDSERSGSRRGVVHEYPFRNEPFYEDLGRGVRGFNVECHVVGEDYFTQRNALVDALEMHGAGPLEHPYWGTRTVAVRSFTVKESFREGGIATFSIQFIETRSTPVQPSVVVDAPTQLAATSDAAMTATGTEFLATYSPGVRLESVSAALTTATNAMADVANKARLETQDLATLNAKLTAFKSSLVTLINTPADLLTSLSDLVTTLANGADPTVLPSALLRVLYALDFGLRPAATTSNRVQELVNFDATCTLFQRAVMISAVRLAPSQTYDSFESAVTERDALAALIDEQADTAADDTYPQLQQLRADLTKAVPGDASDLPHLVTYTPAANVPSLVLAHRLYGNVDSELDIVSRNDIRHPAFISGNAPLGVLSDD